MSLITEFDPWKNSLCTCPPKYSLSPYTGCGHCCLYCYASSYIPNFSSPRPKKDFLARIDRALKKIKPGSYLALSNSSDPYQPLEKQLQLTRQFLLKLTDYSLDIMLVTKSSLITRDIDILKTFPKIVASLTLTTLNPDLAKKLEPGAPLPEQRLKTIEQLSRHIPVACRIDPLIPGLNLDDIPVLVKNLKNCGAKQIITSTYKSKGDNFLRMKQAFPEMAEKWDTLYKKQGEKKAGPLYLSQNKRKKLLLKVKEYAEKEGLKFSSCREGFPELNTAVCDGSSLFRA